MFRVDCTFVSVCFRQIHQKLICRCLAVHRLKNHDQIIVFIGCKRGGCLIVVIFDGPQILRDPYICISFRIRVLCAVNIIAKHIIDPLPFQQRVIVHFLSQRQLAITEQRIAVTLLIIQVDPFHGFAVPGQLCVHIKIQPLLHLFCHSGLGNIDANGDYALAFIFHLQVNHAIITRACHNGI